MPVAIGRDRLFSLLKENGLLIEKKRSYAITTDSNHPFKRWPNLAKSLVPSNINELWVADITYIRTNNGFLYLALITDVMSKMIVGYDLSNTLAVEGALKALKMGIKKLKPDHRLIHHSDRGIQYCSYEYTGLLINKNIQISMTQSGSPYDNALAERINGILKHEYLINQTFVNFKHAYNTIKQAIFNYNYLRPNIALNMKKPSEFYF